MPQGGSSGGISVGDIEGSPLGNSMGSYVVDGMSSYGGRSGREVVVNIVVYPLVLSSYVMSGDGIEG